MKPDFFIKSSEVDFLSELRECYQKGRISGPYRNDGMWIQIRPTCHVDIVPDKEISDLIIFSKHKEATLYPLSGWPIYVYVYAALDTKVFEKKSFKKEEVVMIAWAELLPKESA